MEIFIAYTKLSSIDDLGQTIESWDAIEAAEPAAIEVPVSKYELFRRVSAENISTGDYILSDIGHVPSNPDIVSICEKLLIENKTVGLFTFDDSVHLCRKGIIEKWPEKQSTYYLSEHKQAYRLSGYGAISCKEEFIRRLAAFS